MKLQQLHNCPMKWESIPGWDERTKFCQLCTKKIHDFENASEQEIKEIMKGHDAVCAKIPVSKMQETLTPFQKVLLAMVICFSGTLFKVDLAYGQEVKPIQIINEKDSPWTIFGSVRDSLSQEGLIGAVVLIEGTKERVVCDIEGNFKLLIPSGKEKVILKVSFVGFESKRILVENNSKDKIVEIDDVLLGGEPIFLGVIMTIDPDSGFEKNSLEDLFQREKYLPGFD